MLLAVGGIAMKTLVFKRSLKIAGRTTSISVEDDFWSSLQEIANARHQTLSNLVSSINAERQHANLSSAVRLFVLGFYRNQLAAQPNSSIRYGDICDPRAEALVV
jgi:predicted DNA-binding ribbon-helix-helix protein